MKPHYGWIRGDIHYIDPPVLVGNLQGLQAPPHGFEHLSDLLCALHLPHFFPHPQLGQPLGLPALAFGDFPFQLPVALFQNLGTAHPIDGQRSLLPQPFQHAHIALGQLAARSTHGQGADDPPGQEQGNGRPPVYCFLLQGLLE